MGGIALCLFYSKIKGIINKKNRNSYKKQQICYLNDSNKLKLYYCHTIFDIFVL